LKHELEAQSQELLQVNEQFHVVQLELQEKQKSLEQAKKIKELEQHLTKFRVAKSKEILV